MEGSEGFQKGFGGEFRERSERVQEWFQRRFQRRSWAFFVYFDSSFRKMFFERCFRQVVWTEVVKDGFEGRMSLFLKEVLNGGGLKRILTEVLKERLKGLCKGFGRVVQGVLKVVSK